MASNLLSRPPIQTIKITPKPSSSFTSLLPSRTLLFIPSHQQNLNSTFFFFFHQKLLHKPRIPSLSPPHSSLSPYNPPTSKEEAILQAKTCLSTTLEKPLNNPRLFAGKFKKQKQPRFRVEIPVFDDSNDSLTQLAFQFFQDLVPSKRKGTPINTLILWPNQTLTDLAEDIFSKSNSSNPVQNLSISSMATNDCTRNLNAADVAVFLAPETSQLEVMRTVSEVLYPKPVVVFNPKWGFEEENGFGELSGFVGSFEVVYSFMGLEVRGLLSKRNAVVFKCVKDGVLSGEQWVVLVEDGGRGDMKVLSRFKKRPLIGEVENLLYNLMAVNSPVTKSVKFFRDLVSNVTGKK